MNAAEPDDEENYAEDSCDEDDYGDMEADDFEEEEEPEVFSKPKDKKLVPSEEQVEGWKRARKMSQEFNDEDWKKLSAKSSVEKYTGHGSALDFQAMEVDSEIKGAIPSKFTSSKLNERDMKKLEELAGAMGMAATLLVQKVRFAVKGCTENINDFMNPKVEMDNPQIIAEEAIRDVQVICNFYTVKRQLMLFAGALCQDHCPGSGGYAQDGSSHGEQGREKPA